MGLLDGVVVVITGSGRGIGAACAKAVALSGARVVVNDIDAEPAHATTDAIRAAGGTAVTCVADVSDWDDSARIIATALDTFGRIDGLVNNAALITLGRLEEFDATSARRLVESNVLGPLHCAAHAIGPMLAQGSGSIVNVTSGAHLGMPTMGVYGATKGAVASMTYTWALELEGTGVRVNGLSPFAFTRMSGAGDPARAPEPGSTLPPPEHNTPVVEFLLSDLSRDVNGQILRIDGDELSLYAHPALLLPPAVRRAWSAEAIADAFAHEFAGRQVPSGVVGTTELPVALATGFWARGGVEREPHAP